MSKLTKTVLQRPVAALVIVVSLIIFGISSVMGMKLQLIPDMDMPVKTVDGQDYVGVIILHELGLELPVMGDWDYAKLKKAPCHYFGSTYRDDMVIMAHNYRSQFGRIRRLKAGNRITFTDMDGNAFHYRVNAVEVLSSYEVEKVTNGEWDLTLFTCTLGGQNRIVVRCERE